MAKTLVYQMYAPTWAEMPAPATHVDDEWKSGVLTMANHLKKVKDLGADWVLVSGLFPPGKLTGVDPSLGRQYDDFSVFMKTAHHFGLKVIMDLGVPYISPWLIDGKPNPDKVDEYRDAIECWTFNCEVDGFCLFPPGLKDDLKMVRDIFKGYEDLCLMLSRDDFYYGSDVENCAKETPVKFVRNVVLDRAIKDGSVGEREKFNQILAKSAQVDKAMLCLEDLHSMTRFTLIPGITPEDMIWWLFTTTADGICLYQGQELGTTSAIKAPLSLAEYREQEDNPSSYLNLTKAWVKRWKNSETFRRVK